MSEHGGTGGVGGGEPEPTGEPFEVLASNAWFILGRDDEGYAIWPVDEEGEEPVRRFPDTDGGSESAFDTFAVLSRHRRGAWLPLALVVAAAVAGVVWILSVAYTSIPAFAGNTFMSDDTVLRWIFAASQIAYPVFLVASALFVMVWMYRRDRAPGEGPAART